MGAAQIPFLTFPANHGPPPSLLGRPLLANQCVPMPKPVQQEEEPQPCCSNQVPDRNELLLQKEMSGSKPMRSQRRPTCVEWAELENVEESTGSGGAEAAGDDAIDD